MERKLFIMKLYLCLLALNWALCLAAPTLDSTLDDHWNSWKKYHDKKYQESEEGWRRMVWEKNLKMIELHNLEHSMGKHSFRMGMNHFGDMTVDEIRQVMHGLLPLERTSERNYQSSKFIKPNFFEAPKSVDWREKGYVTPVKNQGACGSCWAFSATGALEGQHFRKTGKLVSLSEQNLMDCSWTEGNLACEGGLPTKAFKYVMDQGGLDSEVSYPYKAQTSKNCKYNPKFSSANETGIARIEQENEVDLMNAVAAVGPVSVAIDAHLFSFAFYQSGIYYDSDCSSEELSHAVLVVGYGYEHKDEDGKKYWIVKNSWGEKWGEDGYIRMAKDRDNLCGIATLARYPLM